MDKKRQLYFMCSIFLCLNTGFVSVYGQEKPKGIIHKKKSAAEFKKMFFPKIEKYNVKLELVSPVIEFKAGKPAKLTFRLRNYAFIPLVVYEWMRKESNNIRIYYIPLKKHMKKPDKKGFEKKKLDKKDWSVIIPDTGDAPKRQTLELSPRNSVVIDKTLPFVESLKTDVSKQFLVFAELNLASISARSTYITITVKP